MKRSYFSVAVLAIGGFFMMGNHATINRKMKKI